MPFNRIHSSLLFSHHLHNSSSNLDPGLHIEMVCWKALRMSGIIMMLSKDLKLSSSFKVLCCALVRQILEYGAILCDLHTADNACQVERVQRRLLRYASYISGIDCSPHDYKTVANQLGLASLAERRRKMGTNFLKELLAYTPNLTLFYKAPLCLFPHL